LPKLPYDIQKLERLFNKLSISDPPSPLDPALAARVSELLAIFGEPNRVRILWVLTQGEISVSALAAAVDMSVSAVSHHLRQLRLQRLVQARPAGRRVFYCVDDDHIVALLQQVVSHVQHS
jgi:ArsR family transcriptional regulator